MNLLVIDAKILTPTQDGRSVRMLNLLKIIMEFGINVTFVGSKIASWPPFDETLSEDIARMEAAGIQVLRQPTTESVEEHLEGYGKQYDVVLLSGLFVTDRHLPQVQALAPQAKIIYDTVDLVHIREFRQAKLMRNAVHLQKALRLKAAEIRLANMADTTIVISNHERDVLAELAEQAKLVVVSNIHEVMPTQTPFEQRHDILFVGGFQHRPNEDAIVQFVDTTMPLLRETCPGINLIIIGSAPTDAVRALASDDIKVLGHVEHLRPYFEKVRMSIAPLRFGAGVKGKVLASMGFGVPTVISPIAAEGMDVRHKVNTLIADTPEAFSRSVQSLYYDKQLWNSLATEGLKHIRDYFSVDAARQQLRQLFTDISH